MSPPPPPSIFFLNDPAPTEFYTLSLHDALPISVLIALGIRHFYALMAFYLCAFVMFTIGKIGRAHSELQSRSDLVCRLLLEKKKSHQLLATQPRARPYSQLHTNVPSASAPTPLL